MDTHLWTLVGVQVSMYGLKQKNTQVMIICVQVPMYGLFVLTKHHFCGYFLVQLVLLWLFCLFAATQNR